MNRAYYTHTHTHTHIAQMFAERRQGVLTLSPDGLPKGGLRRRTGGGSRG